ncbi:MAG: hypothetical protein A2751_01835 [Candidatus Doudnabacteria bacterium RIFCSPHIGHO2_01_FULL_46_14]|uniref:Transcriptional repressor PaaX-like central Cas2-like domain-containing protein n=1 Tax=Candidatus Doudnabacteria bacterium RIFCSPHIGHO2_01_FULL_46_14 TaxID=1817824 RepID=A0A1F5NJF1_9BACT|nr:MAG: hypothetical protein A2751_01835 [Candidatus Doudnabacteria bacterium RIFCSPHIGHO2_01_FULL_46_14]
MLAKSRFHKPVEEKFAETILAAALGGIAMVSPVAAVVGVFAVVGAGHYLFRQKDFNHEVRRLKRKGYVALTKTENGWIVRILNKGKARYRKIQMSNLQLAKSGEWDRKWRLFIFDIPEDMRHERDYLRRKLKQLDLYNIQRSVFAYPFDCRKELSFVADYYNIEKYTTYAEVSYTDIDKELKRHFTAKKIL